jgi:hypothetical protein
MRTRIVCCARECVRQALRCALDSTAAGPTSVEGPTRCFITDRSLRTFKGWQACEWLVMSQITRAAYVRTETRHYEGSQSLANGSAHGCVAAASTVRSGGTRSKRASSPPLQALRPRLVERAWSVRWWWKRSGAGSSVRWSDANGTPVPHHGGCAARADLTVLMIGLPNRSRSVRACATTTGRVRSGPAGVAVAGAGSESAREWAFSVRLRPPATTLRHVFTATPT